MARGWTPERRAKQAAMIRAWRPWEQSTGPRSHAGKARAAQNSFKTGEFSRETNDLFARLRVYVRTLKKLKGTA